MLNFDYQNRTRIVFGRDTHKQIGELIKPYADKILLHYGSDRIKSSGLYGQITASLKENGISFVELGGVVPNPRVSLVRRSIELCRKENVKLILAVGGGSVIDSAKATAMGVLYSGDVWDIYEKQAPVSAALPVATILTFPAAGSESSVSSVITNEEKQIKMGRNCDLTRPVFSIMNPELYFSLPMNQVANGVADMMSHILERYFTNTEHTDITDGLCEATLRTIMKHALILKDDPRNYDAWCEVSFGGTIAHNNLLGLGRVQDWACHAMEHELSAIYDVAHGAGLAVLTPHWMRYVYREDPGMFLQFAVNVMGVGGALRQTDDIILEGIARLAEFFKKMGLPGSLTELGIGGDRLELMARKATGKEYGTPHMLGNFKKLGYEDVLAIYRAAR